MGILFRPGCFLEIVYIMTAPKKNPTKKAQTPAHLANKNPTGLGDEKNIIVLVYADWCGHCQALKPEWEKMEEAMKGDERCEIVKIESEDKSGLENLNSRLDGERIDVSGYPTILSIDGQTRKHHMYNGGRSADALIAWAKNGGKPLVGGRRKRGSKTGKKKAKRVRKTVRFRFW